VSCLGYPGPARIAGDPAGATWPGRGPFVDIRPWSNGDRTVPVRPFPIIAGFEEAPEKALDEANARGWTVVDMKTDWERVHSFE